MRYAVFLFKRGRAWALDAHLRSFARFLGHRLQLDEAPVCVSIFSMKMPYPVVGFPISTCVTAPTRLPFWIMGLPDRSVVNKGP